MTSSGAARRFTRSAPRRVPPLPERELEILRDKICHWPPFDGDTVLDDAAAALDDVPPGAEDTENLARRLRGHLARLVTIAAAAEEEQRDPATAQLGERARTLSAEDVPGDHRRAVSHLRRMGWVVNELLGELVEARCLKEVA